MGRILEAGMETQECLSAFPPLDSLLSFLSPCKSVQLLAYIAAGRGNHLPLTNIDQFLNCPDAGPLT